MIKKIFLLLFLLLNLSSSGENLVFADKFDVGTPCNNTDRKKDANGNYIDPHYCIDLRESIGDAKAIRGRTGLDIVGVYVGVIYRYVASIIGIICVLIVVVSGVQMISGGASPDMVTQAKTRMWQALLSLILLFASAAILHTINPGFFGV